MEEEPALEKRGGYDGVTNQAEAVDNQNQQPTETTGEIVEKSSAPHPGHEAELKRMLKELERLKTAAHCNAEVADFVKPYLLCLLKRREEGKGDITIAQFCREQKVCEQYFHQGEGKQHSRLNCRKVCCGVRRCAKCFHCHPQFKCYCSHTREFLKWVFMQRRH